MNGLEDCLESAVVFVLEGNLIPALRSFNDVLNRIDWRCTTCSYICRCHDYLRETAWGKHFLEVDFERVAAM